MQSQCFRLTGSHLSLSPLGGQGGCGGKWTYREWSKHNAIKNTQCSSWTTVGCHGGAAVRASGWYRIYIIYIFGNKMSGIKRRLVRHMTSSQRSWHHSRVKLDLFFCVKRLHRNGYMWAKTTWGILRAATNKRAETFSPRTFEPSASLCTGFKLSLYNRAAFLIHFLLCVYTHSVIQQEKKFCFFWEK